MGLQGECVKEYLDKYPKTPSKTLASLIFKENSMLFSTLETVRTRLRYYRGSLGKPNKEKIIDKTHIEYKGELSPFENLPEGMKSYNDWEPIHIQCENALIIADLHAPYHEKEPLQIALEYGKARDIDTIVLLGDIADFYSVSFWEKDPRRRDFNKEREIVVNILTIIRDLFPDTQIIYKVGNHEERYERYLKVKAPELFGIEEFEMKKFLHLDDLNIQVVGDRRILKIARLNLIHGQEFGRTFTSPVNPARGLYLKGKEHALCAHYHQTSHHAENSMNDNFTGCWSIGCLSDMHPDWLPINKWNHGFAIVNKYSDKEFEVFNKKIIEGKVFSG